MAAKRLIRNWTDSEAMDILSPHAEVFFTRLIMTVDDFGNYYANHKLLKGAMFPLKAYTDVQVAEWLDECLNARSADGIPLMVKYEVAGKAYIHINNFGQRKRSMKGKFPEPPDSPAPSPTPVDSPPPIVSGPQTTATNARPEERREKEEVEGEVEVERERTLAWFEKLVDDDIWRANLATIHPGKDIPKAIREAYGHIAGTHRLKIIDPGGAKRLVNTWLSNTRQESNSDGKNSRRSKEIGPKGAAPASYGKPV